ncbi:hypothetical protein A1359_11590 [Methylomonas lenta]|uniref:Uncharacterized protein n=1 Tax=Methylomonas lenta TaxID=980561 RepID=A0A177N7P6_9GAMM|nr:DUF2789 family protein [Methylomonas lenta]OAI13901.1 hypothetical protein A1359_11590 [Methylomonas lenta]
MDTSTRTMLRLFCQLGLAGGEKPLLRKIALSEADFWNEAQAAFLAEAVAEDSDWCHQFRIINKTTDYPF